MNSIFRELYIFSVASSSTVLYFDFFGKGEQNFVNFKHKYNIAVSDKYGIVSNKN